MFSFTKLNLRKDYESSSTKLDLWPYSSWKEPLFLPYKEINTFVCRFVPDDMEFTEEPKSECTEMPAAYNPSLFVSTALAQSKVSQAVYV
jgi:hypothetical protein